MRCRGGRGRLLRRGVELQAQPRDRAPLHPSKPRPRRDLPRREGAPRSDAAAPCKGLRVRYDRPVRGVRPHRMDRPHYRERAREPLGRLPVRDQAPGADAGLSQSSPAPPQLVGRHLRREPAGAASPRRSPQDTGGRALFEPLFEDLGKIDLARIDWVIVGAQSGAHARPMMLDWVRLRSARWQSRVGIATDRRISTTQVA